METTQLGNTTVAKWTPETCTCMGCQLSDPITGELVHAEGQSPNCIFNPDGSLKKKQQTDPTTMLSHVQTAIANIEARIANSQKTPTAPCGCCGK